MQPSDARLLVEVVQKLSLARDMAEVMRLVRSAARQLTGADGATFVLRDPGERCYYADEDAIGPLWKGSRFPMSACISGWCMLHREQVVIEDIYQDPRIPIGLYETTFVRSLAMVPIRTASPIGAIGSYWATKHRATEKELELAQALADSASIAIENVQLYETLERRVEERTAELLAVNAELEAFAASASHDLKSPLTGLALAAQALERRAGDPEAVRSVASRMVASTGRMQRLISDLIGLSRLGRSEPSRSRVDLTAMATEIAATERAARPEAANAEIHVQPGLEAEADPGLLRVALTNLISNALKYSSTREAPVVRIGSADGAWFVADNGVGFDPAHADRLFVPFQRLHGGEFEGTGIGLATVARVVRRHGGQIWARSEVGQGATFSFTLGPPA
jgi:signal transduction histidine kinase